VSSSNQYAAVFKQCRGMAGAAPFHLWSGPERPVFRVVQFRGVERGASRVRTAASDKDASVGQQSSRMVDTVLAHRAGGREPAGGGIIKFRPTRSASANQYLAVAQQRRALSVAALGHRGGGDESFAPGIVELRVARATAYDQDFTVLK
jgi:hypothetical protein